MAKTNKIENIEAVPKSHSDTTDNIEKVPSNNTSERCPTYVVIRDRFRVSDREYLNPTDPIALAEQSFWNRIAMEHSYGEPVEIVEYESRKHRVW
jgi:hypothetical protein